MGRADKAKRLGKPCEYKESVTRLGVIYKGGLVWMLATLLLTSCECSDNKAITESVKVIKCYLPDNGEPIVHRDFDFYKISDSGTRLRESNGRFFTYSPVIPCYYYEGPQ